MPIIAPPHYFTVIVPADSRLHSGVQQRPVEDGIEITATGCSMAHAQVHEGPYEWVLTLPLEMGGELTTDNLSEHCWQCAIDIRMLQELMRVHGRDMFDGMQMSRAFRWQHSNARLMWRRLDEKTARQES